MFEDSLVESVALLRTDNRWPAIVSITAQLCVAALFLTIPLLHPEVLPLRQILPATLAPPRAPAPPPPIHIETRPAVANSAPAAPAASQPSSVFRDILHTSGSAVDTPPIGIVNLGNMDTSLPPGINSAAPSSPHVTVGPSTTGSSSKPFSISRGVSEGHLIAPIRPEYPQIARITHMQGTVVIDAIISRTGSIESARVLSGPPMFHQAALDAVQEARYRPFLLNGQPTEVQTTITINFRMGG